MAARTLQRLPPHEHAEVGRLRLEGVEVLQIGDLGDRQAHQATHRRGSLRKQAPSVHHRQGGALNFIKFSIDKAHIKASIVDDNR